MTSRTMTIWRYLAPAAEATSVGPRIETIDLVLKARIQDVKQDLGVAKDRIQVLTAEKADAVHTHAINQITNLQNILNQLQARIAVLEAKVP